ncbi:zinc finger protein jing homolog [Phlebotomus argentipes]|uniref:zinc finger protein jing homolog n=1 Tax=Phlebotomus argentipes TaxID=94469 RepID=UPI0028934A2B|nr:zinc finger protein jing homolog [Phlebotomus argentipes]
MADGVVCLDDEKASKSETCVLSASQRISASANFRVCAGSDTPRSVGTLQPPMPLVTAQKTPGPPPRAALAPPAVPGVARRTLPPPADPAADQETDECRKKRCTDRYDSSESSDSGVAALSCTDSSTTSSDTSDPGSPYSLTSLEELQNSTMAPRQAQSTPTSLGSSQITPHQWPWSSGGALPSPIAPAPTSNNNNSTTSNNNLKRTESGLKMMETPKRMRLDKKTSTPILKPKEETTPQTKITGYFKSQMKPVVTMKKDLTNLVIRSREFPKAKVDMLTRSRAITTTATAAATTTEEARKKGEKKAKALTVGVSGSNKVPINKVPVTPPKRPVTIAPRLATTEKKPLQSILPADQVKHQPTVVLTAIRLPSGASHTATSQSIVSSSAGQMQHPEAKAPPKVNPVFQLPVVSNFVQIPNILTKGTTANLLMNGGHLARINSTHPGQYFLNGTGMLKLATSTTGTVPSIDESGVANGVNGGGVLTKPSATLVPLPKTVTSSASAQFPANGFASPVFMTTPQGGILLNATLPAVITSQYSSLTQSAAVHQIQTTATNLLPSFSTLLQQTQHHQAQSAVFATSTTSSQTPCYQFNQAPIVPNIPASGFANPSLPSKIPQPTTVTAAASTVTEAPPKMSPVTVNVEATTPVAPIPDATKATTVDLRSPALPTQTPETPAVLPSPSPKSLVLEKIQLKTCPDLEVVDLEDVKPQLEKLKSPRVDTDLLTLNLPECAKSPILSQPKTIRFPPQNGEMPKGVRKSDGRIVGVCYWDQCSARFDSSSKLLDHLQTHHVTPQTVPFSCLWAGCKVHSRQSCSRRWLEGHVLSHGGPKTFKCIFDGCGQRFGSRVALEKHVNSHLNTTENSGNSTSKRTSDLPMNKLIRRNGKKLRYRRQPWSARMFDFFDSGIMESLQHRLLISSAVTSGPDGSVVFHGKKIGCRVTPKGTEFYVSWTPANIIPDEWVMEPESGSSSITKTVPLVSLDTRERIALQEHLRGLYRRESSSECDDSSESAPKLKVLKRVVARSSSPVAILEDFSVCPRQRRKHHRKPPKRDQPS